MHIRIITPVATKTIRSAAEIAAFAWPGVTVSHTVLDHGPASIESEYDHALAQPDTIRQVEQAEADGVDAVVIDCMGDPALFASRERVAIPVLGPGQTSMHLAATLGHRFSIVTILDSVRPMLESLARLYGAAEKLASVRVVDVPVLEIHARPEAVRDRLVQQAVRAVEEDHADVIVLGCTGFAGFAEAIADELTARGLHVPVIDPVPATLRQAAALIGSGLSHSKRGFPQPRAKAPVAVAEATDLVAGDAA